MVDDLFQEEPTTRWSPSGHWEGDLIICKRTRPVLVLHERNRA